MGLENFFRKKRTRGKGKEILKFADLLVMPQMDDRGRFQGFSIFLDTVWVKVWGKIEKGKIEDKIDIVAKELIQEKELTIETTITKMEWGVLKFKIPVTMKAIIETPPRGEKGRLEVFFCKVSEIKIRDNK